MKKVYLFLAMLGFSAASFGQASQLTDEEYAYVTMDLQGILNLTMTTDPNVGFTFKSIPDYRNGIIKFNATKLEVDATVAWDLFAYASTDEWTQVESYSTNGTNVLPAEILHMQVVNGSGIAPANFVDFASLKGRNNSGVTGAGVPTATTQFLAGAEGDGFANLPGSAAQHPTTHQFRVHYKLKPDVPAAFPESTVPLTGVGYAQAGYYYLEVVYALVEDL